jgi:exonuclease SbcC
MKLKNLHIENIRSYRKLDLAFEDGVTVVSGVNGSGKSSLLEACFMGLFGSNIIFKGAEDAKLILDFEHFGKDYRIEQAFHYSQKSKNASSSRCVLYAGGESMVDQATRTYEAVCALLNMDEEAYRNCSYIRQGEIDVLINAKPKDRQRMIDDLLQLGKLEEYRERVSSAETGVRRLERDTKNSLSSIKAEIEEIEQKEPVSVLNGLRQKVKECDSGLQELSEKKEAAASRKQELERLIAEYRERLQEVEKLNEAIQESQKNKKACFEEKEKLFGEIQTQKKGLLDLGEENFSIREESGFGDLQIEALLAEKEKEEALAREKVSLASKELALLLKEEEAKKQVLADFEKDKGEANHSLLQCRSDIEATKKEIETYKENIAGLEEKIKQLKEKANFGNTDAEIVSWIKKLEEKESLLRDQKNEVASKLALALKDKETGNQRLLELENELQTTLAAVQKERNEIEILEGELKENSRAAQEVQSQKSEAQAGLQELGFAEDLLENLEDFSELLLENKNRLHGREKELEAVLQELEKNIQKNRELLAAGKCPTCGQELKGSEIACHTEESEHRLEKLSSELVDTKTQQVELEKKLNRLKDAKKIEKKISDCDLEVEKLKEKAKASEKLMEAHNSRIKEGNLKLETFEKQKQEFEAGLEKLSLGIKELRNREAGAQKTHMECEKALSDARAFEKQLAENTSETEKLNGKIRTSLALIENYRQRAGELEERLKELGKREEQVREKLQILKVEAETLQRNEEEAKKAHENSEKLLLQAKKYQANLLSMDGIKHKISEFEVGIKNLSEKIDFFDREILERSERIRQLKEKMEGSELQGLQEKRAQFEDAQENIARLIEEKTASKDALLKEIGMVESSLKRLREIKAELLALENRGTYLEAVYRNAEELENTYLRIRADMRARNIGALSALLNEMFSFMYANNAYSRIELDSDYNLTVFRKDGVPLEPKLLSGGERAIFNLILRCAIYRLLALGFGGNKADGLPPMILDEPTVFLDRGHVRQLLKLIDTMRNIGVGQIIIVSHDESLIDSADHVFHVEKDPLTNMSSIQKA